MNPKVNVKLGQTANLLFGYRPNWNPVEADSTPFFIPTENATETFPVSVPTSIDIWDAYPTITIHENAQSLLTRLYDYQVLPLTGEPDGLNIPAGPLTLNNADSTTMISEVSKKLDLNLTKGYSFMLVEIFRIDGESSHESVANFGAKNRDEYLTQEGKTAIGGLTAGQPIGNGPLFDAKITKEQAEDYVETIYKLGSHFVSKVTMGDKIYQAFAYRQEDFDIVKKAFDADATKKNGIKEITGMAALNFEYYARPVDLSSGQRYGYVSDYGSLNCMSDDANFVKSVKDGKWLEGPGGYIPSKTNSIFVGGNDNTILDPFDTTTSIALELTPIASLITDVNKAWPWERFVKGALLQKYGEEVSVPLRRLVKDDWADLFPESVDSWVSTIVTPNIDVYQERIDLAKIEINAASLVEVKSFGVFSQIIETSGEAEISIPGSQVTLVSQIIDTALSPKTPVLKLSSEGFKNVKIHCHEMYGALSLEESDGDGRNVLLDGFIFENLKTVDPTTKRFKVEITDVATSAPTAELIEKNKDSIGFSLTAAESLMNSRGKNAETIRIIERDYLLWLASIIPADTTDKELANARFHALYLAKVSRNLKTQGVVVPYLTYSTYSDYVNSIISVADSLTTQVRTYQGEIQRQKALDANIKSTDKLNENIKKIGGKLVDYFGVLSQNQQDMKGYYDSVINQLEQEFNSTVTNIQDLSKKVTAQQSEVQAAVTDLQFAYRDWERDEIFKFSMQLVTGIFELGTTLAGIPGAEGGVLESLKTMFELFQKIQEILKITEELASIDKDIDDNVKELQNAASSMGDLNGELQLPSQLEMSEFAQNVNAALAGLPTALAKPKANLIAAVNILAMRGQALVDAKAKERKLYTEIYLNKRKEIMNQQQAQRFADLKQNLHLGDISKAPVLDSIDLIGLTGKLQFQLKQILGVLAKTLILQDGAIQYEYLGTPVAITNFDLTSLKTVMMKQKGNIINGLSNLNPTPKPVDQPIVFRINKVPVSALKDGKIYGFPIQPSETSFFKYVMVRADRIVADIVGIKDTTDKEYEVHLTYEGNPYVDRDYNRKMLSFNTVERRFGPYVYKLDGTPVFGNQTGKYDDNVTKVTPFSHWQISLPKTETNKGIEFIDSTVDIVLSFNITAQYVDPTMFRNLMRGNAGLRAPMLADMVAAPAPAMAMALADTASDSGKSKASAPTLTNLTDQMYQNQSVLQGWDVVFNLLEEPVNTFLKAQWEEKIKKTDDKMEIKSIWCEGVHKIKVAGHVVYFTNITLLDVNLSEPLLQFETNNHNFVTVRQNIISGTLKTGTLTVDKNYDPSKCKVDPSNPDIDWDAPVTINLDEKPYVQGTVALNKVQGIVDPPSGEGDKDKTHSIVLDFPSGSFTLKQFKVDPPNWDPDHHATQISNALADYFTTHDIKYIVNTINFADLDLTPAIQPTKFKLNVMTTNAGNNILQQFITTNGTQRSALTINVNEPIPYDPNDPANPDAQYKVSLMISTKIMFQNIFVDAFNKGGTTVQVEAKSPGPSFKAYSADVKSGSITGTVDFGKDAKYRISAAGNNISWDLTGMTFLRTNGPAGLAFDYSTKKKVKFQYHNYHPAQYYTPPRGMPVKTRDAYWTWDDHEAEAHFKITGNYPIQVVGKGKDQKVQLITSSPPTVNVSKDSSLKPTGACETNDNDLKIKLLDELAKDVPAGIQKQMEGITFEAISIFALENLLFPASKIIDMQHGRIPGDLLVVGTFVDKKKPS